MKRIAIFNADEEKEPLKQWGDFADMAVTMLEASRDSSTPEVEYKIFQVYRNEFPTLEELKDNGYIGLYITGSDYDAHDLETGWINKLRQFLRVMLHEPGYPPMTGVCFGHQIIATTMGCKVAPNPAGHEGGIAHLAVTDSAVEAGLFQKPEFDGPTKELYLSELHNDIVHEVPEGYINIASSEKCPIQGLYKKGLALTFQGHPEFITEAAIKCGESNYENGVITARELAEIRETGELHGNDGVFFAEYIWKLFKREI
ncbi:Glutamine amidotransferase type-1 domain-containing protein [Lachancea thermotolerans]|uniref:KLTH0G12364p n=1 Tax=Lachancea thermotolerans (strain ATCC 56472 / CBS 6340 / NRRL Y-8284) TaxID=559295 RepID=C5DMX2_LACTC|nr:KLTH0G12364p [Lachancea thermotolerans CBS 6340]CAR25133.1 KLTH0G12364p [Lachancea thermotolerans CBS 6340]